MFEFGLDIARRAGEMLLQTYEKLDRSQIRAKGRADLVTAADEGVERFLAGEIQERFPDHGILAEEFTATAQDAPCQWIIDPLDGTVNYAHGLPLFCVSIAFAREGALEWGIVAAPRLGEVYTARRGEGAFCNERRIRVSAYDRLAEGLMITGFACKRFGREDRNLDHFRAVMKSAMGVRRFGSAALDFCFVAAGRSEGFWEYDLNPWDKAAGGLIVEEAGGRVTALDGAGPWFHAEGVLATNGALHDAMATLLGRGRPEGGRRGA